MLPIIATLLSQGLSLVANATLAKGKEWLQEKTGVDLTQAELSSADLLKLRQYEMEHEEELLMLRLEDNKLSAEIEMAYLKDTQSAREMQVAALKQDDLFAKRFLYYFAISWSAFAALYIMCITLIQIPEDNRRFADTILGFLLGTIIAQIIAFFFGSSRSSQAKDATIQAVIDKVKK